MALLQPVFYGAIELDSSFLVTPSTQVSIYDTSADLNDHFTLTRYILAARMESTGLANMIHVSQATANLLAKEGKSHWLKQREDLVEAKGKGKLITFWLNPNFRKNDSSSSKSTNENAPSSSDGGGIDTTKTKPLIDDDVLKQDRLVDWMVELLTEYIQKMVSV